MLVANYAFQDRLGRPCAGAYLKKRLQGSGHLEQQQCVRHHNLWFPPPPHHIQCYMLQYWSWDINFSPMPGSCTYMYMLLICWWVCILCHLYVFFSCMCCESDAAGLGNPSCSCPLELPKMPVGQDVSRKDWCLCPSIAFWGVVIICMFFSPEFS